MISIRIEGDKQVVSGLNNMAKGIVEDAGMALDRAAYDTQLQMKHEAPYKSGVLAGSVSVEAPSASTRIIEPIARNFAPGNKYARPVEEGSGSGYMPNVHSIARYFGVDLKVAWAIALKIKESGTPANPFVTRTFNWIKSRIDSHLYSLLNKMTARYMAG